MRILLPLSILLLKILSSCQTDFLNIYFSKYFYNKSKQFFGEEEKEILLLNITLNFLIYQCIDYCNKAPPLKAINGRQNLFGLLFLKGSP